jgi:hypothetical protein
VSPQLTVQDCLKKHGEETVHFGKHGEETDGKFNLQNNG